MWLELNMNKMINFGEIVLKNCSVVVGADDDWFTRSVVWQREREGATLATWICAQTLKERTPSSQQNSNFPLKHRLQQSQGQVWRKKFARQHILHVKFPFTASLCHIHCRKPATPFFLAITGLVFFFKMRLWFCLDAVLACHSTAASLAVVAE